MKNLIKAIQVDWYYFIEIEKHIAENIYRLAIIED